MSDRDKDKTPQALLRYVRQGAVVPQPKPVERAPEEEGWPRWKKILLIAGLSLLGLLILAGVYVLLVKPALDRGSGGVGVSEPTQTAAKTTVRQGETALPPEEGAGFRFLPPQEHTQTGWSDFQTLVADVDGDGHDDLIWNLAQEDNRIYVAQSRGDGTFEFLPAQEREEKRWSGFRTLAGDVNGDGRADLIWNETAETNRTYVGLGRGDGSFDLLPAQDREEKRWGGFQTLIGDVNGDGRSDLIWNETTETNRTYVALGQEDGSFLFLPPQDHPEKSWERYQTLLGDVNGDGRSDLVWNLLSESNRFYIALAQADGTFQFQPAQNHPQLGWEGFHVLLGDVNGDGRSDLIWNHTGPENRIYVGQSQADGTFVLSAVQKHPEQGWEGFQTLVGDVNGDGRSDLIWNETTGTNRTYVGLSQGDGSFNFLPAQDHPETGWAGFQTLTGDVNGDGRSDLIWNQLRETNLLYVGISEY